MRAFDLTTKRTKSTKFGVLTSKTFVSFVRFVVDNSAALIALLFDGLKSLSHFLCDIDEQLRLGVGQLAADGHQAAVGREP
jgi:hypothetical protein